MSNPPVGLEPVTSLRTRRFRARGLHWLIRPIAVLVASSFLIIAALSLAPGNPAASLAGPKATPAQIEAVTNELGLDQSAPARFVSWWGDAARGDFGKSIVYREETKSLISGRIGTTTFLAVYAAIIILIGGIGFGIIGGAFPKLGPVVAALCAVGIAIPAFVAAQLLVTAFALDLSWFPTTGSGSGFFDQLWHLTLPAIALALGWSAYVAQITRTAIREESRSEHVETARNRGVPSTVVFRHHILRNAAIPISTISGLAVAGLVAGTVIVESAFAINGIGSLLVTSVSAKDYNVVQAISILMVLVFVVVTTLIDVLQIRLDPRLKKSGST